MNNKRLNKDKKNMVNSYKNKCNNKIRENKTINIMVIILIFLQKIIHNNHNNNNNNNRNIKVTLMKKYKSKLHK